MPPPPSAGGGYVNGRGTGADLEGTLSTLDEDRTLEWSWTGASSRQKGETGGRDNKEGQGDQVDGGVRWGGASDRAFGGQRPAPRTDLGPSRIGGGGGVASAGASPEASPGAGGRQDL